MLPNKRPTRDRFDPRPDIARLETDRTGTLRDLHPDLSWVWDELDELRAGKDVRADMLAGILDTACNWIGDVIDQIDAANPVDPNPLAAVRKELDDLLTKIENERTET